MLQAFDESRIASSTRRAAGARHHHVVQQPFDAAMISGRSCRPIPAAPTTVSPREAARDQLPIVPDRVRRQLHGRIEQLFLAVVRERQRQRLASAGATRTCGRGCGRPG